MYNSFYSIISWRQRLGTQQTPREVTVHPKGADGSPMFHSYEPSTFPRWKGTAGASFTWWGRNDLVDGYLIAKQPGLSEKHRCAAQARTELGWGGEG